MTGLWALVQGGDRLKLIVDILGALLTAAGLLFAGYQFRRGVQQYQREQRWKQKDYAAQEYDRLMSEPRTALPLQMLDWDIRTLPLLSDREGRPVSVVVDRTMLGRALIPHQLGCELRWGAEEAVIRDHFDALLERLSSFEIMIAEGLIERADLAPYLSYWIALIAEPGKRSSPDVIHILWLYIERYEFRLVPRLARRFGYTIAVPDGFSAKVKAQCRDGYWSRRETVAGATPDISPTPHPPPATISETRLPDGA